MIGSISLIRDDELAACLEGLEQNRSDAESLNRQADAILSAAMACDRRAEAFALSLETFLRLRCDPNERTVVIAHGRAMLVDPREQGLAMILETKELELDESGVVDLDEIFPLAR